ncbi:MAG: hypothetical protein NTY53_19670 [Kiritimatiellaeota bacterium]|nr:hypothetical protein [Kiritimatiellota bacterium]
MKALIGSLTFGLVVILTAGCEGGWQFGGSSQSWNSSEGWVDFSGRYLASAAHNWIVSDYSNVAGTNSTVSQTLFVSEAGKTFYTGTIDVGGIIPASISGFVGDSGTFAVSAAGVVSGGLSGNINLTTGAFALTLAAPSSGVSYFIIYAASGGTSPGGTGVTISALNIAQEGNTLQISDNNGSVYQGNLGAYTTLGSTPTGDTTNGLAGAGGQTATVQYEAHGVSAAGMNVEMTGNFLAQVSQSVSIIGGTATNIVVIQQTWNRYD